MVRQIKKSRPGRDARAGQAIRQGCGRGMAQEDKCSMAEWLDGDRAERAA